MRENRDRKITLWLIGFGCGIVLSGIVMMFYVFNSKDYQQGIINTVQNTPSTHQTEEIESIPLEDQVKINAEGTDTIDPLTIDPIEEKSIVNGNVEELIVEEKSQKVNDGEQEGIETENKEAEEENTSDKNTITVYITQGMKANEIFNLLEQKKVIDNARSFYAYVAKENMTKYLRHGTIEFPKNADYGTVLRLLSLK